MAVKKSQLYSTLWESCNALRGSMDASQYKDYVLMILFVKYLSDKAHQKQTPLQIPEGCYFEDFVALKQNDHIGELINEKLEAIREANAIYIGDLTLPNFNDPAKLGETKTRTETLSKLIAEFQRNELNFGLNRAADDDLLGDAYEYLMKNFAAESGKSKGQFYTPAEVSRVMAKVLHLENLHRAGETIYDPTCGSGSLLLRALNETSTGKCAIRGQELDSTTAALAKLNMLLHGIVTAQIKVGDTLNAPKFTTGGMLETFDVCVANPPFSKKNWLDTGGEHDEYHRWSPTLLPPYKSGDFAFLLHLIASMKENTGRGACILPHGVLFRGGSEYDIRKDIVQKKYIKGIIGLPPNLFFGTGIPACIIIIDKASREQRKGIFMINAKAGYMKDGAKNRLREQDIKLIVDTWNKGTDVSHYARFVEWAEIEKNDFNLNLSRYITPFDTVILQDIHSHLNLSGGLPEHDIQQMSSYWTACPSLKSTLFSDYVPGYFKLNGQIRDIGKRIAGDESFKSQIAQYKHLISGWLNSVHESMMAVDKNCSPKAIIGPWGDSLLATIPENSLVNRYDVYNYLMNYWAETVQDDCYMVSNDGWVAYPYTPQPKEKKKKDGTVEKPKTKVAVSIYDIVCDLLPVEIVVNEFFDSEKRAIDSISSDLAKIQGMIDTLLEEKSEFFDDFEKVSESKVGSALKDAKRGVKKIDEETMNIWFVYLDLCKSKKAKSKELATSHMALLKNVFSKYEELSQDEVRALVVDDKWQSSLNTLFIGAMDIVSNGITERVTSMAQRYEFTLDDIGKNVVKFEDKVSCHFQEMGVANGLLTGSIRLPGFSGPWKQKNLGKCATIKARIGWQGLTTNEYLDTGDYYLITGTDFYDGGINWGGCHFVSKERFEQDPYIKIQEQDVLITKDGTIGKVAYLENISGPGTLNSGVFVIRTKDKEISQRYLAKVFISKYFDDFIDSIVAGSTIIHLYQKDIVQFDFYVPPTIEEQNAICDILEDIDNEIKALSTKLNKYKMLKQGIIQGLLVE